MKSKLLNNILIMDILTIILVIGVLFIPFTALRIVLGIPLLLFFPGYMLVEALFLKTDKVNGIERIAFSMGLSIAISGLIGFILDYTPWGIRAEPVAYSVRAFIIAISAVALIRITKINNQEIITSRKHVFLRHNSLLSLFSQSTTSQELVPPACSL